MTCLLILLPTVGRPPRAGSWSWRADHHGKAALAMGSGDLVNFNGGACPRRPAIQPGKDTCPEAKVVHRGGGGCKRHKSRFGVRIYPEYNGPASCDAATRAFWPRSIADGRLSVASELRYKESFCTHPPLRVPRRSNARTLRSRFSRKVVACKSLHTEGPHRASRVFTNGGSPCSAHAGPQFQASPYSLISGGAIYASPRSQVVVTGGSLAMRRFKLAALISLSSSPGWAFSGETCFWAAVARAHRGGIPPGQWPMPK